MRAPRFLACSYSYTMQRISRLIVVSSVTERVDHLENQDAGAFAHDKAIALRVKRPRSFGRSVVKLSDSNHGIMRSIAKGSLLCWPAYFGRQRLSAEKAAHGKLVDRSLRAAGHHEVCVSMADQTEGVANAVASRSARSHARVVGSLSHD